MAKRVLITGAATGFGKGTATGPGREVHGASCARSVKPTMHTPMLGCRQEKGHQVVAIIDSDASIEIDIEGVDKIWSAKSRMVIPKSAIERAYVGSYEELKDDTTIRSFGLGAGRSATVGRYRGRTASRQFWICHGDERLLALDTDEAATGFDRVVLGVAEPESWAAALDPAGDG